MALSTPLPPDFEELPNFRDVSTSVNKSRRNLLKPGLLFRSGRPDDTTSNDRALLVNKYKIKTIVDLRTTTELLNAIKKYENRPTIRQSAAVPSSNDALIEPLRIPGIEYTEINLNGKGFERSLLWHLSYYSLAKVITYMIMGYRMEAIGIIGREVLQPRGLVGLAIDTLEHSQPEIKSLFDLLSQKDQWPLMLHCTQGKDRTGLSVILVLLLCHIDINDITEDYSKSEPDSEATLRDRLKDTSSIGLDESFARCPRELPQRVKQHIDQKYGSIEKYLNQLGVTDTQLQQVREILLQTSMAVNDS